MLISGVAIAAIYMAGTAALLVALPAAQIDLNSANRDMLMTLDGIGEVRADAIIRSRPFKLKTELVERRLIPEALYERIADKVAARAAPVAPAPRPTAPVPTKR